MLIIQHIWTRWSKRSRGANSSLQRPLLAESYALPDLVPAMATGGAIRHEVRALEADDFKLVEEWGAGRL